MPLHPSAHVEETPMKLPHTSSQLLFDIYQASHNYVSSAVWCEAAPDVSATPG